MKPEARIQSAIEILDTWLSGDVALEQATVNWARKSRFAGSGDRAAVRDHVFEATRRLRSDAALGGAPSGASPTGRQLMLGAARRTGVDPDTVFGAGPRGPHQLSDAEREAGRAPDAGGEALDLPDWILPEWNASLGALAERTALEWQRRAPVHLRTNVARISRDGAAKRLEAEGVAARPHQACDWALEVDGSARVRGTETFREGLVELQDAGSQSVVAELGNLSGARALDYCAGGGGKTLALAAAGAEEIVAHDADAGRMRDLPERARRAGLSPGLISIRDTADLADLAPFDVVVCDVPCSGSGAWRRSPEGKWRLSAESLGDLARLQARILEAAAPLVAPGGALVYTTCSLLNAENGEVARKFARAFGKFELLRERQWGVADGTDGFYAAQFGVRHT